DPASARHGAGDGASARGEARLRRSLAVRAPRSARHRGGARADFRRAGRHDRPRARSAGTRRGASHRARPRAEVFRETVTISSLIALTLSHAPQHVLPWHRRLEARVVLYVIVIAGASLATVLVATDRTVTRLSIDRASADLGAARLAFNQVMTRQ